MTTEEYEKRIYDLSQLLEISRSLNSTLDINILLDSLLYTIMGQLRVINIGIFLQNYFDNSVYRLQRNYKGFDFLHGNNLEIPSASPVLRKMAEKAKCYTLGELAREFPGDPGIEMLQDILPSLIIPMVSRSGLVGFIVVGEGVDGEIFTEDQQNFVLDIALFAAIAIHNSVLFEMASTDMMTKLKLRHYFLTMLEKTYEEAVRRGKVFAVIMIDIDHFKKLNDTYGHPCGDDVLIEVASIIRNSVRKIDVTARYGGEEFIILLPDISLDAATTVGERIRTHVEQMTVEFEDTNVGVTVSLGVALFDKTIDFSPESVIKRADLALYSSKESGRNRLTVSREKG
ncbi:MAG: sensor domain-containing diguanylate cyclase [Spirochaetales bacterium]|nr:sensor domain-containing diguanylate cyclase [Spirochaetales bacterium]